MNFLNNRFLQKIFHKMRKGFEHSILIDLIFNFKFSFLSETKNVLIMDNKIIY